VGVCVRACALALPHLCSEMCSLRADQPSFKFLLFLRADQYCVQINIACRSTLRADQHCVQINIACRSTLRAPFRDALPVVHKP